MTFREYLKYRVNFFQRKFFYIKERFFSNSYINLYPFSSSNSKLESPNLVDKKPYFSSFSKENMNLGKMLLLSGIFFKIASKAI